MPKQTDFGDHPMNTEEKSNLVAEIFHRVATKYDLMNDIMSMGLHRLWKRKLIQLAQLHSGQIVLDVAAGTGDLSLLLAKQIGPAGKVVMTDVNETMLALGQDKMIGVGLLTNIEYVQADAEQLPFADHYFDRITIAFGLRNVTNKTAALDSFYRVLKPGGKLLVLEFSHPSSSLLNQAYDFYSFKIIPKIGEYVANDRASYQYLVESIRVHPNQKILKQMLLSSRLEDVEYVNLTGGIVAIHTGYKY